MAASAAVAHRPCSYWLQSFLLCHHLTEGGCRRQEWPDGKPLLFQPWPRVAAFGIIGAEWNQLRREAARREAAANHPRRW